MRRSYDRLTFTMGISILVWYWIGPLFYITVRHWQPAFRQHLTRVTGHGVCRFSGLPLPSGCHKKEVNTLRPAKKKKKKDTILQMTFAGAFSLFLKVEITISQHWLYQWLAELVTSHYLNQWWPSFMVPFSISGRMRPYKVNICIYSLTYLGQVKHICVGKLTIIGSDYGLAPGRRQAIIWTNTGILSIQTLRTNFNEILSEIHTFSFKKMPLKMSSAK